LENSVIGILTKGENGNIRYRDKVRYSVFLNDVLILALTSLGGPQVHLSLSWKDL